MFRLFRYALSTPAPVSKKGMHTGGTPPSVHQGSKRNILR